MSHPGYLAIYRKMRSVKNFNYKNWSIFFFMSVGRDYGRMVPWFVLSTVPLKYPASEPFGTHRFHGCHQMTKLISFLEEMNNHCVNQSRSIPVLLHAWSTVCHKIIFHHLRIRAIHGAKITKNQTPLVRFAWLFYNQTFFQKYRLSHLSLMNFSPSTGTYMYRRA